MAIYRFSAQVIGRSSGRSAVAAAAYRAGERLRDERIGQTWDYERKLGIVHKEILAPEGSAEWALDRSTLWNAVQKCEKRKDATLAREIQIALPTELTHEQQVELLREFVREQFVARGMVADVCLHREEPSNSHAHVMLTMRPLGPDGFGYKERSWNDRKLLYGWRASWSEYANRTLAQAGHEERIDHRSYVDQQIPLEPQPKLGRKLAEAPSDGRYLMEARLEAYRRVVFENGERIRQQPEIALRLLTQQRATFRREDLLKVINTHTLNAEQFDQCLAAVMASPELVKVGLDAKGTERFSSHEMLEKEQLLVDLGEAMALSRKHRVATSFTAQAMATHPTLSAEQRQALAYLTSGTDSLALLEGHAGTGKSFLLGAAREAWEAQGFVVVGGALAGKAAEGLELSSGIAARTLASWEHAWGRGAERLTPQHVLVIDEAGMVGTRQLARVLANAAQAGAKVVLVGDSHQLQAIEAGAPFRALGERLGSETLSEVRRQRVPWQREATMAFPAGQTAEGVKAYQEHGHIKAHKTTDRARAALVRSWMEDQKQTPIHEQLIYAYRRDDVHALNQLARAERCKAGKLGSEQQVFATEYGERAFATGDRLFFGKNDRSIGVTNGTIGTIEAIEQGVMMVRLDGGGGEAGRSVFVNPLEYQHLDHGYAVTVHKSQGVTVDRTYVLASKLFDSSTTYVALSRHRDNVEMHWARDEFGTLASLNRTLCRDKPKEMALELNELELIERGGLTLSQVLEDDSQFAMLSPDVQRQLLQEYAGELEEQRLKNPTRSSHQVLQGLPEIVAADQRSAEAATQHAQAARAFDDYGRLGFIDKLRVSEDKLRQALVTAENALDEARRARAKLERDPKLVSTAEQIASEHNLGLHAAHQRLKQWRTQLTDVERAELMEHAIEHFKSKGFEYQLASDQEVGRELEVFGDPVKLGKLSDGYVLHAVALRDAHGDAQDSGKGRRLLFEVNPALAERLKKHPRVTLARHQGELVLNAVGLDRGRGDRGPER